MPRRLFEDLVLSSGHRRARSAAAAPLSVLVHAVAVGGALAVPALVGQALPEPAATAKPPIFAPAAVVVRPVVPAVPMVPRPRPVLAAAHDVRPRPATFSPPSVDTPPQATPTGDEDFDATIEPSGIGFCFDGACSAHAATDTDAPPTGAGEGPPGGPIRITSQLQQPAKLRNVDPVYPALAQRAGVEGRVTIECVIDPSGHVADVRVVKGAPLLTPAAVDAVRQWVYSPTLLNRVPVSVILTVTVDFRLRR
jgi:periplasmic protein TonB